MQGSTPVSEGCDHYIPCFCHAQLGPALRYLTPTGRVPQLMDPNYLARGRYQAAESQPRRDYRKLTKAATNYDSRSEVTRQWLLTELMLLLLLY